MKTAQIAAFVSLLAGAALGQVVTGKDMGDLKCCVNTSQGNFDNIKDLNNDLRDNGVCESPAHTCTRVACGNTSGVYLCNQSDADLEVNCSVVADYADNVNANCRCDPSGNDLINGQQFDNRQFYVLVEGANCNDSPVLGPA